VTAFESLEQLAPEEILVARVGVHSVVKARSLAIGCGLVLVGVFALGRWSA
jgi:hypothetical protein